MYSDDMIHLKKLGIEEEKRLIVELKDKTLTLKLCSAYGETPVRELLSIIGSSDFLGVAINQGNAAQTYDVKIGDPVKVKLIV